MVQPIGLGLTFGMLGLLSTYLGVNLRWAYIPAAVMLVLGLIVAAGLLCLSITARSLDLLWCAQWPHGTHFLWHSLNALMFVVVLESYRRHWLAARPLGR